MKEGEQGQRRKNRTPIAGERATIGSSTAEASLSKLLIIPISGIAPLADGGGPWDRGNAAKYYR